MLWCFHCHDKADGLAIRQANRDAHLAYLDDFDVAVAGPLLDENDNMCGSLLLVDLPDAEAAKAFADGDPYARAGLFDQVSIRAFKTVFWPS